ncbi:hypothetical protein REPUB_Repub13aG0190900 [Reevesia pubescens]
MFPYSCSKPELASASHHDHELIMIIILGFDLHVQYVDFETSPKVGRPPSEAELQQFFFPYRGYCARKGIQSHEVVLHDIDVPSALVDFINNNNIGNIVVGASNRNVPTRSLSQQEVYMHNLLVSSYR